MKIFKKQSELKDEYRDWSYELALEIVFHVFLTETEFPEAEYPNCAVVLLKRGEDFGKIYEVFPYAADRQAEVDETIACGNGGQFRKLVYIWDDSGAGISVFMLL